jgi:hypothetical protein
MAMEGMVDRWMGLIEIAGNQVMQMYDEREEVLYAAVTVVDSPRPSTLCEPPDLLCPQPRLELQQRATEIVKGADFMRQEIAKPNRVSVGRST